MVRTPAKDCTVLMMPKSYTPRKNWATPEWKSEVSIQDDLGMLFAKVEQIETKSVGNPQLPFAICYYLALANLSPANPSNYLFR